MALIFPSIFFCLVLGQQQIWPAFSICCLRQPWCHLAIAQLQRTVHRLIKPSQRRGAHVNGTRHTEAEQPVLSFNIKSNVCRVQPTHSGSIHALSWGTCTVSTSYPWIMTENRVQILHWKPIINFFLLMVLNSKKLLWHHSTVQSTIVCVMTNKYRCNKGYITVIFMGATVGLYVTHMTWTATV